MKLLTDFFQISYEKKAVIKDTILKKHRHQVSIFLRTKLGSFEGWKDNDF